MDGWTIAWLAWLVAFLGIEIPAALNDTKGDTLSEHVWGWIGNDPGRKATFAAFLAALSSHFLTQAPVLPVIMGGIGITYAIVVYYMPKEKLAGVWNWLNGKKSAMAALLLAVDALVPMAPVKYVGVVTAVVGLLHKWYKAYYHETA